jgi:hypothetical protein
VSRTPADVGWRASLGPKFLGTSTLLRVGSRAFLMDPSVFGIGTVVLHIRFG